MWWNWKRNTGRCNRIPTKDSCGKTEKPCTRAPRGFCMGGGRISTMGARESQVEQRLRPLNSSLLRPLKRTAAASRRCCSPPSAEARECAYRRAAAAPAAGHSSECSVVAQTLTTATMDWTRTMPDADRGSLVLPDVPV